MLPRAGITRAMVSPCVVISKRLTVSHQLLSLIVQGGAAAKAYEDYRRRVPMLLPWGGRASGRGVELDAQHASDVSLGPRFGEEL